MVSIFFTIEFFLKIWYTRFNQLNESEDIKMDILETYESATQRKTVIKNQAIESSKREKINALIKRMLMRKVNCRYRFFTMNRNVLIHLWLITENLKM